MAFTGNEFVGLDDDAFGDGQDDTLPLDQWLQNRLYGNLRYLSTRESISWCPFVRNSELNVNAGDRPVGTITEWQLVRRVHWPKVKGLTGWTIAALDNVQSQGATQDDVEWQIEVDQRLRFNGAFPNTDNAGTASFEPEIFDIDLQAEDIPTEDRPGYFTIDIYIRSTDGGAEGVADADLFLTRYTARCEDQANTFFNNSTAGNPDNATSLETMYIRTTETYPAEETINDDFDLLFTFPRQPTVKPGIAGLLPQSDVQTGFGAGSPNFLRRFLNYVQFRGIAFEPKFAAESIPYIAQDALRAKIETSPLVGQTLRAAVDRLQSRPRVCKVMPEGYGGTAVPEYYKDLGYGLRWPYVLGNEVTPKALANESIWLDAEDPIVVVVLDFIAVHHLTNSRDVSTISGNGETGLASWDITIDIETLPDVVGADADWDTDAVTKATINESVSMLLHGASQASDAPLLRQLHWLHAADPTEVAESMHKEGTLYRKDLALVESVPFVLEVKGFDTAALTQCPARLKVSAELDPTIDPVYVSSANNQVSALRLVMLNATVNYRG